MSDIYTIAKSGLKAYREGLATTGQNIANVGNDAYSRREASISEVKSGSPDVLQISDNISFGVKVNGITRAFDQFIDTQLHNAKANFSFSEAQTQVFNQLETVVRPESGSVSERLNEFFSSLSTVALDPSDMASRNEVINSAKAVTHSFQTVANGINELRAFVGENLKANVLDANSYLKQLSNIQKELLGNTNPSSVRNDLLDQRDRILAELSEIVEIKTHYMGNGEIEVLAGTEGQGQVVLSGFETKEFSVAQLGGSNKIFIGAVGGGTGTKVQVSSGKVAGLIASEYALGQTKGELDSLAQKFVAEINEIQKSGIDLDGEVGSEFFNLNATEIQKFSSAGSNVQLQVSGLSEQFLNKTLSIEYVAEKDFWTLSNDAGHIIGEFEQSLEINGVMFTLNGEPGIGDHFSIQFTDKKSENLALSLNDGRMIAASSYYLPERHMSNTSSVTFTTEIFETDEASALTKLNPLFSGSNNSANPITFKENGVLGSLRDVDGLQNLTALKQQTKLQFSQPISNLDSNSQINLTVGGTAHTFTLGAHVENVETYADLSKLFNNGVIRADSSNLTFSDLGLRSGGSFNNLIISSGYMGIAGNYSELQSGNLEGSAGLLIPGNFDASNIQVLTKEGVHLAGTTLSDAQLQNFITSENGFSQGAEYNASNIANSDVSNYMGAEITRLTTSGYNVANITSLGHSNLDNSNSSVGDMANIPSSRAKMTDPLLIQSSHGEIVSYESSQGMMAGQIASALNDEVGKLGIKATAFNYLEFYDVPSEVIEFDLQGSGGLASNISVDLSDGNIQNLINQINLFSETTGISASKSAVNSLVLSQEDGNEIIIKNAIIGGSESIGLRQLDQYGEIIKSPENDALPTISTGKYAIFGGQIELRSPANFTLSFDGAETPSVTEEFANGFIKRDYLPNLSATNYKFQTLKAVDDASTGSEGYVSVAPSSSYKFDIKGDNANKLLAAKVLGAYGEDLSDTKVAVGLAKELRQQSPSTRFSGNTFTLENGFPKNGDTLNFRLGDQTYNATLNGVPDFEVKGSAVLIDGTTYDTSQALKVLVDKSKFTISGPEADRIRVGFSENSDGFSLYAVANDGVISGHTLRLSDNNPADVLSSFHIDDTSTTSIQGLEFDTSQSANLVVAQLVVGTSVTDITFNNGVITPASVNDIQINLESTGTNLGRIKLEIPKSVANSDIRLKATDNSENFGINTASTQLTLNASGFSLSEYGKERIEVTAEVQSLASEMISIDGLMGEDLIVIATGNTRPTVLGSVATTKTDLSQREITAKIISDDGRTVELSDKQSGDRLGVRTLSSTNNFLFRGLEWQFDGLANKGDTFTLSTSGNRKDDASNILRFSSLAMLSEKTGKGGYGQIYSDLVTNTGYKSRDAEQRLETTKAIHNVALDRKSAFSGVDLDTEAARLLEQQQAYQALAKVLSTAKELVDTLLRSF